MWKKTCLVSLTFVVCASVAAPSAGLQLTVSYAVLERVLERELFRDQGRYYLSGSSADDCSYAYLEDPDLRLDGGRLALRLHFSGRAGAEILGQCVGAGDAFEVLVTGVPAVQGGSLVLGDPQLSLSGHPEYEDLLRPVVAGPLAQALRFDLGAELKRLAEGAARQGYRVQIGGLEISRLRAAPDRLEIEVELKAAVTLSPGP